ncbi:hypothetical protein HD806DRAFT_324895 [Xylariaceae sp. AK1471]|nr:hypothetical protein HD806DRAFT_324895 [Xylariaceae sp. AK1471]
MSYATHEVRKTTRLHYRHIVAVLYTVLVGLEYAIWRQLANEYAVLRCVLSPSGSRDHSPQSLGGRVWFCYSSTWTRIGVSPRIAHANICSPVCHWVGNAMMKQASHNPRRWATIGQATGPPWRSSRLLAPCGWCGRLIHSDRQTILPLGEFTRGIKPLG